MTSNCLILVVDDNAFERTSTARILEHAGFEVAQAGNGETALTQVRALRPGLVLLDVHLPDVSGPEVLRQIRLDPTLIDVSVVMSSAFESTPEQLANCLDTGADGFIARPVASAELLARVRSYLRRSQLTQQLRVSEERYRMLFERSPQPMFVYDTETLQILAENDSAVAHYGYSPAEFRAMTLEDLHRPEQVEALRESVRSNPGTPRSPVVWSQRRKDGSWIEVEVTTCDMDMADRTARLVLAHDITERKLAEDALRTSERQFSNAFEFAVVGMALVAPGGGLLKVNRALCQMLGYAENELLARDFKDLSHPDDLGVDAGNLALLLAGEIESFQMEKRYLHRLGDAVWTLLSVSLVRDEAGSPVHFISQVQDISARKEAAAEIERTTDLLQAVVEGTTDSVFVKDLQGRYLLMNEAGARLAGREVCDVLGLDDSAIFGPEGGKAIAAFDRQVIESNRAHTTEECLTAAGVTRTLLTSKAPYRDGRGNVIGLVGISRDISDRKRAEQHIADQAALIDQARDAIYERDMENRITFWSKGAERIFGWTTGEAVGRLASELLLEDPAKSSQADGTVRETGEWQGENQKTAKDGAVLTLDCRMTLVRDAGGQPRSILAIDTDVTTRKKIEHQLLRSQRMESIGTLAGGIAHDLNNALAPIIMALDLMKARFPDRASQDLLSVVSSSAHRGADMVRQVLSFARGVEGRRVTVDVGKLIRDIEKIAIDTFFKNHRVRTRIPYDLWPVSGDPTQLHQMLMNLSVNARDAMPDGGTLTLSAGNIHLDSHHSDMKEGTVAGPYVFIHVEDSGSGMTGEIVEKIFDPFFTTKEVGKGTGLGLSTSLAIVKSHGGFIQCYSEPGKGTKFTVYLPALMEASAAAATEKVSAMPHGNGELVLVVDDEESVRQITQRALEAYGYRVALAADGAEAVAVFAARRAEIAVVLTDMTMPVMDGPATIQILRRMDPNVRIIAASGLSAGGHDARVRGLGVNNFLPKPYTGESLLSALRQVLMTD